MPLISLEVRRHLTPRFKRRGQRQTWAKWACDQCGKEFEFKSCKSILGQKHFCCEECNRASRQTGNCLNVQICSSNIEKYGAKFASMTSEFREKIKQTNIERYGVEVTSKNADVEAKRRATCEERYGGPGATSSPEVRAKVRQTMLERFDGCQLNDPMIRAHFNATMNERYGAPWAAQSPGLLEKQRATNVERYGVACPWHSPDSIKKAHSVEAQAKRHQTRKRNGSYARQRSLDEISFVEWLRKSWTVEETVTIDRFSIDAVIIDHDIAVQFDGAYWHGLDRDPKLIGERKSKIDSTILGTIARDKFQNEWFIANSKKLLRVKDVVFLKEDVTKPPTLERLISMSYVVIGVKNTNASSDDT